MLDWDDYNLIFAKPILANLLVMKVSQLVAESTNEGNLMESLVKAKFGDLFKKLAGNKVVRKPLTLRVKLQQMTVKQQQPLKQTYDQFIERVQGDKVVVNEQSDGLRLEFDQALICEEIDGTTH